MKKTIITILILAIVLGAGYCGYKYTQEQKMHKNTDTSQLNSNETSLEEKEIEVQNEINKVQTENEQLENSISELEKMDF